jgi:hypothetical protein
LWVNYAKICKILWCKQGKKNLPFNKT